MWHDLWELINTTQVGVRWWWFWHPGSGVRGSALLALAVYILYRILR